MISTFCDIAMQYPAGCCGSLTLLDQSMSVAAFR
jgi:hypothetical protein